MRQTQLRQIIDVLDARLREAWSKKTAELEQHRRTLEAARADWMKLKPQAKRFAKLEKLREQYLAALRAEKDIVDRDSFVVAAIRPNLHVSLATERAKIDEWYATRAEALRKLMLDLALAGTDCKDLVNAFVDSLSQ